MKNIDDLLKFIESWKSDYQRMTDDLPLINHINDAANLQKNVNLSIPGSLDVSKANAIKSSFDRSIEYFEKNNENGKFTDLYLPASGATFASADLVSTLIILEDVSLNDVTNSNWATRNIKEISRIFDYSKFREIITKEIILIRPSLVNEFIASTNEFEKLRINPSNQTSISFCK